VRRGRAVSAIAFALLALASPSARADEPDPPRERPSAGGTLAWVFADELDLVGDLRFDLPLAPRPHGAAFLRIDATTAIEKSTSDFAFLVRDVSYRAEVGYRRGAPADDGWAAVAGQRGRQDVDADGQPWLRYVGVEARASGSAAETGLAGGLPRWSGTAAVAAVVDEREIDADVVLRAALHHRRPWRAVEIGFDVELDGLGRFSDGGALDADLAAGPRVGWARTRPEGGAARYDLFVHALRGRNPLGLRIDGVVAGLDVASPGGFAPPGASWWRDASVGGSFAAGAGDRDGAVRLRLWVDSPPLFGAWRATITLEPNVLTADDTGELYWFYHVGLQRPWRRLLVGAWGHHRSNHTWAEPNPVGVTSLNAFEVGADSPGWERFGGAPAVEGRWGAFDLRARAGVLIDSSFGSGHGWHVRLGARWTAPFGIAGARPFVEAEHDDGDVARSLAALGVRHPSGWGGRIEWRRDDQWFGADDDAVLGLVEAAF